MVLVPLEVKEKVATELQKSEGGEFGMIEERMERLIDEEGYGKLVRTLKEWLKKALTQTTQGT